MNCQKQWKDLQPKLADNEEKKVLEEQYKQLNETWELALHVENMITVMEQFIQKYHNQYLFVQEG